MIFSSYEAVVFVSSIFVAESAWWTDDIISKTPNPSRQWGYYDRAINFYVSSSGASGNILTLIDINCGLNRSIIEKYPITLYQSLNRHSAAEFRKDLVTETLRAFSNKSGTPFTPYSGARLLFALCEPRLVGFPLFGSNRNYPSFEEVILFAQIALSRAQFFDVRSKALFYFINNEAQRCALLPNLLGIRGIKLMFGILNCINQQQIIFSTLSLFIHEIEDTGVFSSIVPSDIMFFKVFMRGFSLIPGLSFLTQADIEKALFELQAIDLLKPREIIVDIEIKDIYVSLISQYDVNNDTKSLSVYYISDATDLDAVAPFMKFMLLETSALRAIAVAPDENVPAQTFRANLLRELSGIPGAIEEVAECATFVDPRAPAASDSRTEHRALLVKYYYDEQGHQRSDKVRWDLVLNAVQKNRALCQKGDVLDRLQGSTLSRFPFYSVPVPSVMLKRVLVEFEEWQALNKDQSCDFIVKPDTRVSVDETFRKSIGVLKENSHKFNLSRSQDLLLAKADYSTLQHLIEGFITRIMKDNSSRLLPTPAVTKSVRVQITLGFWKLANLLATYGFNYSASHTSFSKSKREYLENLQLSETLSADDCAAWYENPQGVRLQRCYGESQFNLDLQSSPTVSLRHLLVAFHLLLIALPLCLCAFMIESLCYDLRDDCIFNC
ncbi:uncharacterized protein LOC100907480 [Galendromus occidentalis]|uniref:Uncharacterized protein LOC100907480 n=1 Tax=Galendromus occidentalis TaxID=34638 RepID=A0AAJ6W0P3_9ACAR|nr:uncharacterized protein LOC100907480 [Galendromus occidentalis]